MAPPHPAPPDPPILRTHDELLKEIFLLLPTAADLARASLARASFRRLITGHAFLRRYRALHPPPLVGVVYGDAFFPAQTPHPSAVAARAFAGFDFSCSSFLPTNAGRAWRPLDFVDGRVLLGRPTGLEEASEGELDHLQLWELAVCDPVFRRYILLPAVPGDLTALVPQQDLLGKEDFLAPGEDEEDPLSFRVVCLAKFRTHMVVLVFSSFDGHWHALTFDQWSVPDAFDQYDDHLRNRDFVGGCFCWHSPLFNKLVLLNTHSMEFSAVSLPAEQPRSADFVIVEAAQRMLGMFIVINDGHNQDGPYRLVYSILRNNQWHSEKVIPLPEKYDVFLCGVAGGYLLIHAKYTTSSQEIRKSGFFSVDVKTLQVELFCEGSSVGGLYAGFPPSLCAPTIRSGQNVFTQFLMLLYHLLCICLIKLPSSCIFHEPMALFPS